MTFDDLFHDPDELAKSMRERYGNTEIGSSLDKSIWPVLVYIAIQKLELTSEEIKKSSNTLEKLTLWLIVATAVLLVVAIPPAVDVLIKLLSHH